MVRTLDKTRLPEHIAIIMDGNGRWARKRGLPRIFGHRAGTKNVHTIVEICAQIPIKALTLYAFSTENWIRPHAEITGLMTLLRTYLKKELPLMMREHIRLRTIGDISRLPDAARKELEKVMRLTENNTGMVLNLALNYGSRQEIVAAVNRLTASGCREITEDLISGALDTASLPDPDLLIRTSGEVRLSNFLLWQSAYAELYFTDVLWPDFSEDCLFAAIADFQSRNRRFGGIKNK